MAKTNPKITARKKRAKRIRTKLFGTSTRPRLSIYRSNCHIYAQIIDDNSGNTLVSFSSKDKGFIDSNTVDKCEKAKQVGLIIAEKAKSLGIDQIVFDRNGYLYHGRVKALSEGAREGGLQF